MCSVKSNADNSIKDLLDLSLTFLCDVILCQIAVILALTNDYSR